MFANQTRPIKIAGLDTRAWANPNSFRLLRNISIRTDLACLDTFWGWEPLIPWTATRKFYDWDYQDHLGVFCWSADGGRTEYIIQEGYRQNGISLYYQYANGTEVTLDSKRYSPSSIDAGTQFIPYGRFLLMLNGVDPMIKFFGDTMVTPFGFTQQPPAPQVAGVDPTRLIPNSSGASASNNNWETTFNGVGIAIFPNIVDDFNKDEWIVDSLVSYKLPSSYVLTTNANAGHPKDKCYWGLGTTGAEDRNSYSYKITWVSDTGAESPTSEASSISWEVPQKHDAEGDNKTNLNPFSVKFGVDITNVPVGPDHVVARRIYRTKNKADGMTGAGEEYFLVAEIRDNVTTRYIDFIPDSELVTPAPSIYESSLLASSFKYGTVYDGRLWLAGGPGNESSVYFSQSGKPEQFGGFDFFDVGVREGGSITGLHASDKGLYVFREHAIDVIVKNPDGQFKILTVAPGIGTKATNTIKTVPGLGIFFLSYDGIYCIETSGRIVKKSTEVQTIIDRLNWNAIAKATAVWSRKWQEYFIMFPIDEHVIPNQGLVWHAPIDGWSERCSNSTVDGHFWNINCLTGDANGEILFVGCPKQSSDEAAPWANIGIQVISRSKNFGQNFTDDSRTEHEGYYTYSSEALSTQDITSSMMSGFNDFGKTKNSTISVIMNIYQTNVDQYSFYWLSDQKFVFSEDATTTTRMFDPDEFDSEEMDPIWDDSIQPYNHPVIATYDETMLQLKRTSTVRFDIQTYAKDSIAWYYSGVQRIQLADWSFKFVQNTRSTILPE